MSVPACHPRSSSPPEDPEQLPDESELDEPDPDLQPDEEPDGQPDPGIAEQRRRVTIND
jgi:hypothetical protein